MKTCALLTTRCSLRRRLPSSASRWALVAALGLSVALLAWSDRAAAQSSEVNLGSVVQQQSGFMNAQTAQIATVTGNGRSQVTVNSIVQSQSGAWDTQGLRIGNASGNGSSKVQVGGIYQTQDGLFDDESMEIGNATNGRTDVTIGGGIY